MCCVMFFNFDPFKVLGHSCSNKEVVGGVIDSFKIF